MEKGIDDDAACVSRKKGLQTLILAGSRHSILVVVVDIRGDINGRGDAAGFF